MTASTSTSKSPRSCFPIDGLNPEDPGMRLLARYLSSQSADESILLAHCGEIANLNSPTTRMILDVREKTQSQYHCIPASLSDIPDGIRNNQNDIEKWTIAATWPRAHLGKDFAFACLAESGIRLRESGKVLCSIRKQKGAKSISTFMRDLFGSVEVLDRSQGYQLLSSERNANFNLSLAQESIEKRYSIDAPELMGLRLTSAPGVFSRKELDQGTRALLKWIHQGQLDAFMSHGTPRVLDLCAGIGPLGFVAKKRWPDCELLAVESNILAVELLRANAENLGFENQTQIYLGDGLEGARSETNTQPFFGNCRLALVNPPTHAPIEELRQLLSPLPRWMVAGGQAIFVACRPGTVLQVLAETEARVDILTPSEDPMTVIKATWSNI